MSQDKFELQVHRRAVDGFFSIFEDMCEGAISVDRDARIVWINEKYRALLGIPEGSEVLGNKVESVIPESLLRHVVETGNPIPVDIMVFEDNHFVVSRLPLLGDSGELIGAVGFVLYDNLDYLKPLISKFDRLQKKLNDVQGELALARRTRYALSHVVGASPPMHELRQQARRFAQSRSPVLLLGETGTGKELLAQSIHALSRRFGAPFVAVNMGAIPENLLESEFFGVAPGAYTGASKRGRPGKFDIADGGTLFLDEIADMPLQIQVKLLRALEEQTFEPVGSNDLRKVDVRIIAATSQDLEAMVDAGTFRKDLYYRLNVLQVRIPPLRERLSDLRQLADVLLEKIAIQNHLPLKEITPEGLGRLFDYSWPGNIRELRNVLERAFVATDEDILDADQIAPFLPKPHGGNVNRPDEATSGTLAQRIAHLEREAISDALQLASGKKAPAARILGISRSTLYEKMSEYNLS